MGIGQSLLNIRNVVISGGKTAKNYVRKHPAAAFGVLGFTGLVIGKALTMTQKDAADFVNHSVLTNPVLNPTGCVNHILHPNDTSTNDFDNPLVKAFVDKNNKKYNNKSMGQTDRDYITHVGTMIKYEHNLSQVIKSKDGGTIEIYTDKNGKVYGSINRDKDGYIRNLSIVNNDLSGYYSINVNDGAVESIYNIDKNNEVKSIYTPSGQSSAVSDMPARVKEFYANGGKGVSFAA